MGCGLLQNIDAVVDVGLFYMHVFQAPNVVLTQLNDCAGILTTILTRNS